jgi:hypothetical protein
MNDFLANKVGMIKFGAEIIDVTVRKLGIIILFIKKLIRPIWKNIHRIIILNMLKRFTSGICALYD